MLTIARFEPTLYPRHLPNDIRTRHVRAVEGEKMVTDRKNSKTGDDDALTFPTIQQVRDQSLAKAETQYLHDLMTHAGGDVQKAVRISGLSQSRLYYLMKKYRITRP